MNSTSNQDHIFNRFYFGSLKSLKGENCTLKKKTKLKPDTEMDTDEEDEEQLDDELVDELQKEVKDFFEKQYSADRMKLVVQVKMGDNVNDVKKWITEAFSTIPNKNLGP